MDSEFREIGAEALRFSSDECLPAQLIEACADCETVLLGEASHGSREFYRQRMTISKALIEQHGFDAVAIEADWPDAWRLNRYVQSRSDDDANSAFADFQRFPEWMWCNHEVLALIQWLARWNGTRNADRKVGLYGLDLYSLYSSARAVIEYLQSVDPHRADEARQRYACLSDSGDPQHYGYQAAFDIRPDCAREVIDQLLELRQHRQEYLKSEGGQDADAHFFAERNARVVRNAERYYRAMFDRSTNTWNLRDRHMADTLFAIQRHLRRQNRRGRVVVWAHNSHLGDARATAMGVRGELNLGQLVREKRGPDSVRIVGFTTHAGEVSAASDWGDPVQRKRVRPSLAGSWERHLHDTGLQRFAIPTADVSSWNGLRRLQRMIGVIYRPETERQSHYSLCRMQQQFDWVVHTDITSAVAPLAASESWQRGPEASPRSHVTRA